MACSCLTMSRKCFHHLVRRCVECVQNSLLWCVVHANPVSSQLARFTRQQIHTKRVSLGSSMDTCNWRWSRRKNSS